MDELQLILIEMYPEFAKQVETEADNEVWGPNSQACFDAVCCKQSIQHTQGKQPLDMQYYVKLIGTKDESNIENDKPVPLGKVHKAGSTDMGTGGSIESSLKVANIKKTGGKKSNKK